MGGGREEAFVVSSEIQTQCSSTYVAIQIFNYYNNAGRLNEEKWPVRLRLACSPVAIRLSNTRFYCKQDLN